MNRLPAALLPAALLLAATMLGGCDVPAPLRSQPQSDAQTRAACRERANQVFDQQNRGAIFSGQSQANMPFSANWTPDVPNRGLSQQFGFNQIVNDCVRNTGTETTRTSPGSGTPAAPAQASPSPGEKTALPPPAAQP